MSSRSSYSRSHLLPFFWLLTFGLLMAACAPSPEITENPLGQVEEGVTVSETRPSEPTITSTAPATRPVLAITTTPTANIEPTMVSTTVAAELEVSIIPSQRICSMPPQRFDFRAELSMRRIIDLRFENEDILTFEGWADRPDASLVPLTPEPTPDMMPGPFPSGRMLFVAGQLNIAANRLESRTIPFAPLLNNPCGEACPLEIISQSPDEQWQLVQISDWLREKMGIWLVGEKDMVKLTHYVPADMNWQWANDSSILWFVYSDPNMGYYALLAYPGEPVIINNGPLAPTGNFVSFSPIEKVLLSTADPFQQEGEVDTDELFMFDLTDNPIQRASPQVIPGLVSADWNDATQSYLFQIVNHNDVEIQNVVIQNQDGQVLVTIPQSILYSLTPSLADTFDPLYSFIFPGQYALSTSGRYLALVQNSEILLFDCSLQN